MANMNGAVIAPPGNRLLRGAALAALLLVAANSAAARGPTAPESTVDPALLQIDEPRFLGAPRSEEHTSELQSQR